ncbi:MFS transporter [Fictibacillus sp. Mic-4]|uniref:MFS transporter n=1 Tax=Fictibacillus sp. Mic-4 TaxID=3132826 RepID=UPI003CF4A2D9
MSAQTLSNQSKKSIPKYFIISILTIFSIGPQYFLNLTYTVNQMIIQNRFQLSTNDMLIPSGLSNLAFALGVPLGRALSRKYGVRKTYLPLVFIFMCGTIIDCLSSGLMPLIFGRTIQGLAAGMLFLTILPVKLVSFPNRVRHLFLFFVITGLFGASAVGAFFGTLSLSTDDWRWPYMINIFASVLCLIVGSIILPKQKPDEKQQESAIDKTGVFLLVLLTVVLAFPVVNLQNKGFDSIFVWPFFLAATIVMVLFIYNDWQAKNPLVPFRALKSPKTLSGTIMAVAGHVSLVVTLAGINGFLRSIKNITFHDFSYFYFCFFLGVVVSAILCTFLYDVIGPGVLGMIGSLLIIFVSMKWRHVEPEASLMWLNVQMAGLGIGISMTLVSGALGTALAGDLHHASHRSVSLHGIRNYVGAIGASILGWFIYRENAIHYELIRGHVSKADLEVNLELSNLVHHFLNSGHTLTEAKGLALYTVIANAKKSAVLGAYHEIFTILLILGMIMLLASIVKTAAGEHRKLVKKETPLGLPAPIEEKKMS